MTESSPYPQKNRRRDALVRAYQTYYLFRNRRLEKLGLKLITFLGIAVPLIAGGVVQLLYLGRTPPDWLLIAAGAIGLSLTVLSLWAVVDRWDEKVQISRDTINKFSSLVTKLELMRMREDNTFDESELRRLEIESQEGRIADAEFGIGERARKRALAVAERKYPPP